MGIGRQLVAETLGTSLLLFVVVGSGIAVAELGADSTTQLFAHGVVVGLGLGALIALFTPVSGAHLNPAVTVAFWRTGAMDGRLAGGYVVAQVVGAGVGVAVANATFGKPWLAVATTVRDGVGRPLAEFLGTFVLVLLILGLVRSGRSTAIAPAVGAWVTAIIVATVSTGFANPAVTVARMFTDTYTGIAPGDVPAFVLAQLVAGAAAAVVAGSLFPIAASASSPTTRGTR